MTSLNQRHQQFYDLHQSGTFVIPNPWDAGSAKMMAAMGAKALATSSAAHAFTIGKPDMGHVTRDEALAHAENMVAATPLPVSGDLENGYGDEPETVAETVRLAAEAGLSGCSIEDTQMIDGNPAYDLDLAIERIKAGAAAAKALTRPFIFCARADGVMNGVYDTNEAIRRLQAFEAAGADLLYAPLLPTKDAIEQLVKSVTKPVNALAAGVIAQMSVPQIAALGVRRISVGSQIARVTHRAIHDSVSEILAPDGKLNSFKSSISGSEIDALLTKEIGTADE